MSTLTADEFRSHLRRKVAQTTLTQALEKIKANHPEISSDEIKEAIAVALKKIGVEGVSHDT